MSIPGGQTENVTFTYSVPNVVRMTPSGKVYRLIVQHQPMAHPVALTVTVTLPKGATVRSAPGWTVKGRVATFHASLTRDLVREIQF